MFVLAIYAVNNVSIISQLHHPIRTTMTIQHLQHTPAPVHILLAIADNPNQCNPATSPTPTPTRSIHL